MSSISVLALALSFLQLQLQFQLIPGRVFERCELAAQLQHRYGLPAAQVATLVCIAQHSSDLNTAAFGGGSGPAGGSHGIFQISDVYWCSPPGQGAGCGLSCARLRDDDIADDVLCVRKIYAETQRISGDGFTAWQAYGSYCRQDATSYVAGCGLAGDHHGASSFQQPQHHQPQYVAQVQHVQQAQPVSYPASSRAKIYSRCELAQELYYQHKLPMQQIPTWVCIAQHESSYNTAAVGRLNADGSADHGLFQISDLFWCTHDQHGGKGCHAACNQFLDSSIVDDVQCIRKIHQEHTQISGDGFTAWTVYNRDCRNQRYEQVAACFAKPQPTKVTHTHPNAIGPVSKVSYAYQYGQTTTVSPFYGQSQTLSSGYQGNPFLRPHPNAIGQSLKPQYAGSSPANPLLHYKHHTTHKQQHYQQQQQQHYQQQQQQHYYTTPKRAGKVYTRCELAQELYFSHKFPMQDLATWVCIAEHESRLDTSAVGRLNADGSADHGLFQISDLYWCGSGGGKGCHIDCNCLLDSDISDDVKCIRTIHEEHTRISGDGFTAWTVYNGHCRDRNRAEIASCFEGKDLPEEKVQKKIEYKPKPKGKIYQSCELAQELYYKHKLPMSEIPTWVCIAQHESSFNTAAVGRLNADGSEDHGLFQISDLYWCSHDKGEQGGKACHIDCDRLLDSDISDDVQCIRTIHEEHTRLSGDGFTAWTVYNGHCRHQSLAQLSDCFDGNEIAQTELQKAVKPNHHGEHPQVSTTGQQVYATNPFLKGVARLQNIQVSTPTIKTTVKPAAPIKVVPKHPYGSNPFLQTIKPSLEPTAKLTESASTPKSSYNKNPFITQSKPAAPNAIQATESKLSQSANYNSNPFLNSLSKPTPAPAQVRPPVSTTPRPSVSSKSTHHPYVNSDIFRNEIIKFTATSSATTTSNHLRHSQSSTTNAILSITKPTGTTTTTSRQPTVPTTTPITITTHWPITKPSTTKPKTTSISTRETTQPTLRPTTRPTPQPTARTTSSVTTQPTNRATTRLPTRPTTRPTFRVTTRPTTRPTVRPTSRVTTLRTTHPTTRPSAKATTRPTTRPTVRPTSQKLITYWTTNRPTARTTIHLKPLSTTRTTARTTTRSTTPASSAIPSTRTTIRTTTIRPSTQVITTRAPARATTPPTKATRPTTRSTTRATTRTTTTRPTKATLTTRSTTTKATTRATTTQSTTQPTSRPTTPSTTTWRQFTSTWRSTTPKTTTTTRPPFQSMSTPTSSRPQSSTTPRPYLFTTTTVGSKTTTDPFSHPFFAKFKAKFEHLSTKPSTTTKPTPAPSQFTASPYYAKFQDNNAKGSLKTVYSYSFGRP